MKRTVRIIVFIAVIVLTLVMVLSACDISRKMKRIEPAYQKKLKNATEYSFDMHLEIKKDAVTNEIDVNCYKKGDEYAYTVPVPSGINLTYRKLFSDNKMYECLETSTLLKARTGTYNVEENVAYTDDRNLLYVITKNIMLATYVTYVLSGKKEKLDGVEVYRYSLKYDGNQYSLWYDSENLVKISAIFVDKESGKEETYSATFSNYKFENVAGEPFLRPLEPDYLKNDIAAEDWMNTLISFGSRAGNWIG